MTWETDTEFHVYILANSKIFDAKTYTSPSLASPAVLQSPIDSAVLKRLSQLTRTQLSLLQLLGGVARVGRG